MLPKKERMRRIDFLGLKPRTVFRGKYLDIAISPQKTPKFSCVISKKRIRRAVERNKVKRRLYRILQEERQKKPYLTILYPKQGALAAPHSELRAEIRAAFDTL